MPDLPPRPLPPPSLDSLPIQLQLKAQAPSATSPPPDAKPAKRKGDMDAPTCAGLAETIYRDLLSDRSDALLTSKRQDTVRAALIARLATQHAEGSDFHHHVLDHVLPKCKERASVLIAWLHAELAKDTAAFADDADGSAGNGDEGDGRYMRILLTVLPAVRNALPDNDRAYTHFLLDIPLLPKAILLTMLEEDVADSARRTLGFATARDVCLQRDGATNDVLAWLLEMSSAVGTAETAAAGNAAAAVKMEDGCGVGDGATTPILDESGAGEEANAFDAEAPALRAESVRVLATHLFGAGRALLTTAITEHAAASLRAALQPPPAADEADGGGAPAAGDEVWRVAKMQLHLALCAKEPTQLSEWLRAYGGSAPAVQALMSAQAASVVPHVDAEALGPLLFDWAQWVATGGAADGGGDAAPLLATLLEAFVKTCDDKPPQPLVESILHLALTESARCLALAVPLLAFLSAAQAESLLPLLLAAPPAQARAYLVALIHAEPPPLPPPRLLLTLHILPTGNGLSMKHLIEGVGTCLSERGVFTMQTMASCLKMIAQHDPLPLLSMRTTIEALVYCAPAPPFRAPNVARLLDTILIARGPPPPPPGTSAEGASLLQALLQPDPSRRIDFARFAAHPF